MLLTRFLKTFPNSLALKQTDENPLPVKAVTNLHFGQICRSDRFNIGLTRNVHLKLY